MEITDLTLPAQQIIKIGLALLTIYENCKIGRKIGFKIKSLW